MLHTLNATELLEAILGVPQPIVAAVHGHARGLGATIALFCDVVVAAEGAQFADTHVGVALVAGDGGAVMWPLIMPFGAAKWYLLTGDPISGAEAARLGMVLKAVPRDQLLDEASALARRLAEGAPLAVQGTKATLNRIVRDRMSCSGDTGLLLEAPRSSATTTARPRRGSPSASPPSAGRRRISPQSAFSSGPSSASGAATSSAPILSSDDHRARVPHFHTRHIVSARRGGVRPMRRA